MALVFPSNPSVGDLYPVDPGTSGVTQYRWDGKKWNAVLSTVSLGAANQGAYNELSWPRDIPQTGQKLTVEDSNTLSWGAPPLFPLNIWNPLPANGLEFIHGGITGTYNESGTISVTGCLEGSINGSPFSTLNNISITAGQELAVRWATTVTCGGAPTGTLIEGTVTNGTYENSYLLVVNRAPVPPLSDINVTNIPVNSTAVGQISAPISGLTAPAYVTYASTSTGANIHASTDGVNFTKLQLSGTGFQVENGDTLYISQLVGASVDTTYIGTIRVGDGTNDPGTYGEFDFNAKTLPTASFPNSNFSPSDGPTASPSTVEIASEGLYGISTAVWGDGSGTLTADGDIQVSVDGVIFGSGPVTVGDGQTVSLIWNPTTIASAPDGSTLTGSVTNGIYTNTFSLVVDRSPTSLLFMDLLDQPLSTVVTSNTFTPGGFNIPVSFSFGLGLSTLLSPEVSINGGAYSAVSPVTVNPGDSISLRGTTGPANNTEYTLAVRLGDGATSPSVDVWSVTTTGLAASIGEPMIASPADGTRDLNPSFDSPAGITLVGTDYEPLNGAGAQTRSDWDVYANGYPYTSTNTVTGVSTTPGGQFSQITRIVTSAEGTAKIVRAAAGGGILNLSSEYRIQNQGTSVVIYYSDDGGRTWRSIFGLGSSQGAYTSYFSSTNGRLLWGRPTNTAFLNLIDNGTRLGGNGASVIGGYGLVSDNDVTWVSGGFSPYSCSRSRDNGFTFAQITLLPAGLPTTPVAPVWDASNSKFLLIGNGICLQATTGISYTPTASAPTMTADAGYPAYYNGTILIGEDQADGKLFRSTDGGDTWATIDVGISGCRFGPNCFTSDGNGNWWCAFQGTTSIGFSGDDGLTWTEIPMGNPAVTDVYSVQYFEGSVVVAGQVDFSEPATILEEAPIAGTTLVIANAASEGLKPGVTVQGSISGATGIVQSVSDTEVLVNLTGTTVFGVGDVLSIPIGTYGTLPGSPFTKTSGTLTNQFLPIADLEIDTSYYARVTYSTTNSLAATSHPSPWVQFSTGNSLLIEPGTIIFGGGYAGQVNVGGTIYNLLAIPDGDYNKGQTFARQYNTLSGGVTTNAALDTEYGGSNTWDNANAFFPLFNFVSNDANGPNAGVVDQTNTVGTGVNGYNDWYVAAVYEALSVYYYLKPTNITNQLDPSQNLYPGSNPISVSPYQPNTNFTSSNPAQVADPDWQSTGPYGYTGLGFAYLSTNTSATSIVPLYMNIEGRGEVQVAGSFSAANVQRPGIYIRRQAA